MAWPRLVLTAVVLIATAGFSVLVQGPIWSQDPALAGANLTVSVLFVLTGWMIRREPGQRGVGWALMLTGLLRPMDFADAGTAPPWAAYDLLFGAADRVLGAYALLRYPNPALLRPQRIFLVLLTGWMLAGRVLIMVTATPQWDGAPASSWWLTLDPGHAPQRGRELCGQRGPGTLRRGAPGPSRAAAAADHGPGPDCHHADHRGRHGRRYRRRGVRRHADALRP